MINFVLLRGYLSISNCGLLYIIVKPDYYICIYENMGVAAFRPLPIEGVVETRASL